MVLATPDHADRAAAHRRPRLEPRGAGRPGPRDPPARARPARPAGAAQRHLDQVGPLAERGRRALQPGRRLPGVAGAGGGAALQRPVRHRRRAAHPAAGGGTTRSLGTGTDPAELRPAAGAAAPEEPGDGLPRVSASGAELGGRATRAHALGRGSRAGPPGGRARRRARADRGRARRAAGRPGRPLLRPVLRRALRRGWRCAVRPTRLLHRRRAAAADHAGGLHAARPHPARRRSRPRRRRRPGRGHRPLPPQRALLVRLRAVPGLLAVRASGSRRDRRRRWRATRSGPGRPAPRRSTSGAPSDQSTTVVGSRRGLPRLDHEVDHVVELLLDLPAQRPRLAPRRAGSACWSAAARRAASSRAWTKTWSGIRTPTVRFLGCISRRGTSGVAGRMNV